MNSRKKTEVFCTVTALYKSDYYYYFFALGSKNPKGYYYYYYYYKISLIATIAF